MKLKVSFYDWVNREDESVYQEHPELTLGDLHHGTVFEIEFPDEYKKEINDCIKLGAYPVFKVFRGE